MSAIWIIFIIIAVVAIGVIIIYNKLVTLRNNRENAFADIDVQLKQRADLVDNLVNTVKGYASHEKEVLENVTQARTSMQNAGTTDEKVQADNMLTDALKSLFAVSEDYPDLKANENFKELQNELSDIENKVASSRRYFNSATKELNTYVEQFPANIIANMFNFTQGEYFEVENREKMQDAPEVDFSGK